MNRPAIMGENKLTLNIIHRRIIDAIIKKSETVCPGSLALIGVYVSACTGDFHEKSDLDLLILINDDAGWQLAQGFILDDTMIGYDIYCTSWEMLAEEAECRHAHLAKLMVTEAAGKKDAFSFMNMASLQYMINEIADRVSIERLSVMESYDPADLEGNVRVFDNGLKQYLEEYETAGISPRHYKDVEEFIRSYLQA